MLYEQEYCARGEMENRIKKQQLYLFADRTGAHTMRANQLRLWFSAVAYYYSARSAFDCPCEQESTKIGKLGGQSYSLV